MASLAWRPPPTTTFLPGDLPRALGLRARVPGVPGASTRAPTHASAGTAGGLQTAPPHPSPPLLPPRDASPPPPRRVFRTIGGRSASRRSVRGAPCASLSWRSRRYPWSSPCASRPRARGGPRVPGSGSEALREPDPSPPRVAGAQWGPRGSSPRSAHCTFPAWLAPPHPVSHKPTCLSRES